MTIAFLALATLAVVSALGVIFSRNAVHSALCLTGNLLLMALLYLMMSLQFLGVAQLVVYAGAIMVVFLFAVTVLAPENEALGDSTRWTGLFVGSLLGASLVATVLTAPVGLMPASSAPSTLFQIAEQLFGLYVFPFECTAFVLLVALIGAALLGHRRLKGVR